MKGMNQDVDSSIATDEMESHNSTLFNKESDKSPSQEPSADVSMSSSDSRSSQTEPLSQNADEEKAPARTSSSGAFTKRRNPEEHEVGNSQDEQETKNSLLHVEQANTYMRDVDFEVALLTQRNKRVLLSRLQEVAPRGRLSLVRTVHKNVGTNTGVFCYSKSNRALASLL